jgi:hypothetical protein
LNADYTQKWVIIARRFTAGGYYGFQKFIKKGSPSVQQIAPVQKSISGSAMVQKAVSSASSNKVEQHKEQKP